MIFNRSGFALILFLLIQFSCAPLMKRTPSRPAARPTTVSEFSPLRKKVALLKFFNEAPIGGEDLAIQATEELRKELARSREFLFDSEAENLFGGSKEIYSGGGIKLAQLSRKARMSGVSIVIFGRVKEARLRQKNDDIGIVRKVKSLAESVVEIKVYDILGNKELYSTVSSGSIGDDNYKFYKSPSQDGFNYRQDLLRYTVKQAVRKLAPPISKLGSKLDWVGRVAKIIGTRIYINAGRNSGLNLGDILRVITEGQEIYDPESGAMIGMSQGEVKGTLEVIDYFGQDGAICSLHSGGSVTEGDFVQLY